MADEKISKAPADQPSNLMPAARRALSTRRARVLHEVGVRISRRRVRGLHDRLRPSQRTLDFAQLGLTLDREQRDLATATLPAFERPAVERRAVVVRGLQQPERNGAPAPARAYRQQRQLRIALVGTRPEKVPLD